MNITVVGTGYVGLVVGACFAETGNTVIGADVDADKVASLNRGEVPIYEPGLEPLLARNRASGRLTFTTDVPAAVAEADVIFIAVGTPPGEAGSADLRHVLAVAEVIARAARRETVVVTKSTVPVGTTDRVRATIAATSRVPVHVANNPEFLKEGAAVDDFMKPDRVVIGTDSAHARTVLGEIYAPFVRTGKPILFMDIASSEMTKYAANGMLATRISFMNDVANLCELVGADIDQVRKGIGSDSRIGSAFLFPGPGYGGSCFPKDVVALARTARDHGTSLRVLEAVDAVNEDQKRRLFDKLRTAFGGAGALRGARVAVWGLAFKPNTDDLREAPSLVLIDALLGEGATVVAHDPIAMPDAKRLLIDRVTFAGTNYEALRDADALVVVTDWNEYRHPDFQVMRSLLRRPLIVDGRNLYDLERMRLMGFEYHSIGRRTVA
jgi:UDPglucose 6-dehydrogenase